MNSSEEDHITSDSFPTDALSWLMATCSKLLRERLSAKFANAGYTVTPEQWAILAHLWQQDGLSQQALANRFHRSKVAAFQIIGKLEKQGLVIRRPDPVDGRSKRIFLTSEGRKIQSVLVPLAKENISQAVDGVSLKDLETAKNVIRKVISNTKR